MQKNIRVAQNAKKKHGDDKMQKNREFIECFNLGVDKLQKNIGVAQNVEKHAG